MATTWLVIRTIAELAVIIFFIWGLFNEKRLIRFERKLVRMISAYRKMKALEKKQEAESRRQELRRPSGKQRHAVSYEGAPIRGGSRGSSRSGDVKPEVRKTESKRRHAVSTPTKVA
ncbi:MAG: hypothetical protein FWF05_05405 [Oscillospiraceae bacterium]|nr:hypothetical protein [Oscillospiraceae bacterium]